MPKETIPFSAFIESAGAKHTEFINQLHDLLLENDCKTEIKVAANGLVVSYLHQPTKRTVANYIFRKNSPMIRVYADHIANYQGLLADWPESMKAIIKKAGPCKRMLKPDACNSRCPMGFDFDLDDERLKKCRYSFIFKLEDESKPHLRTMMEREIKMRELPAD